MGGSAPVYMGLLLCESDHKDRHVYSCAGTPLYGPKTRTKDLVITLEALWLPV
jgi:hypothetical protein